MTEETNGQQEQEVNEQETTGDVTGQGQQAEQDGGEETTFTQAQVDQIIKDRLAREKKRADDAAQKVKEEAERQSLEEKEEFKKLYEAEVAKREQAEAQAKQLELSMLRARVAREVGLPDALAGRLQGDDEDAIREDAKTLAATLPAPGLTTDGDRGTRPPSPAPPEPTPEQIQEFAARMGVDPRFVDKEQVGIYLQQLEKQQSGG